MRVTDRADLGRSDGSGASSSRSMTSRSAGTAQISECTAALTSAHHAAAAVFAAARSVNGAPDRGARPAGPSGRPWRSRPGSPRSPSTPGRRPRRSRAGTRSAWRTARSPAVGTTTFATTPPFRQPIRSASTTSGTPPRVSKHSASSASVVAARSSAAKRTNRNRDHASTAQNTCSPPSTPQSMTRCSPGVHTAGRRPRWLSLAPQRLPRRRPAGGSCAPTPHSRPPGPPAAAASAQIRPRVFSTRSATSSATAS